MTRTKRILIAGAGIAGPALAFWLHRYGYDTVIVERASTLRTGGQNIDVRGAGRIVSRRMGIENQIRAAGTGELGTRFVDAQGRTKAAFPVQAAATGGTTAELEILRGDLVQLLENATTHSTDYRFGDQISALVEADGQVHVSFKHGQQEAFDLVVAADGIRSETRAIAFGQEGKIEPLGLTIAYLTMPRTSADDDWWRWYNAPRGRSISLRPDNVGTIRAMLAFLTPKTHGIRTSVQEQKESLRQVFGDAGWEAPRLLAALAQSDELYFDTVAQIKMPRWSSGRTVLLGDAGYCAAPVSGMGTSLSLVGAYVLAGELATHVDHRDALQGYEQVMRPYVQQAQKLPPVASHPALSRIGSAFLSPPADKINLPDYAHLERLQT